MKTPRPFCRTEEPDRWLRNPTGGHSGLLAPPVPVSSRRSPSDGGELELMKNVASVMMNALPAGTMKPGVVQSVPEKVKILPISISGDGHSGRLAVR